MSDDVITENESQHFAPSWRLALATVLVVSAFPVFFLYFNNIGKVGLNETVLPFLRYAAIGLSVFFVSWRCTGSVYKSSVISALFMLFFYNYIYIRNFTEKWMPFLRYWHVLTLVVLLFCVLAAVTIRLLRDENLINICKILFLTFFALIAVNFITAVPSIVNIISLSNTGGEQNQVRNETTVPHTGDSPNVFYLLFDEYSSISFIKKYYNYDNIPFARELEELGFNVSYSSANDSYSTVVVTANIINLDYVVSEKSLPEEISRRRGSGYLFDLFREQGYTVMGLGETADYGLPPVQGSQSSAASTVEGTTFMGLLLKNTPLYIFNFDKTNEVAETILQSLDYLNSKSNYENTANTFTFMHLKLPHQPFLFDAGSAAVPETEWHNWKDQKYYLGYYQYATEQMLAVAKSLVEADPDCIVIMQSDHSARAASQPDVIFGEEDKCTCFNAVYYAGEELDIEGISGLNTVRAVLDRLFPREHFPPIDYA